MYFVYIIKEAITNRLYYGLTGNLERRLAEHNKKKKDLFELIYYEAYKAESDARNRERRLKHYAQALTMLKFRLKDSLG